jgi:predicted RNA-binding Zn-ribbon protein involved in translation (DUF1610 family)
MAIKRPAKSRGTPLRKPVASAAVRHGEVWAQQRMVPGDLYLGWLCKNKSCGLVVAIATAQSESKAASAESEDPLTAIKCPHCGNEDLYRWSARGEHKYAPRSVGT